MDPPPTDASVRSEPSESLTAEIDALLAMLPRATLPSGTPAFLFSTADAEFDTASAPSTDL